MGVLEVLSSVPGLCLEYQGLVNIVKRSLVCTLHLHKSLKRAP